MSLFHKKLRDKKGQMSILNFHLWRQEIEESKSAKAAADQLIDNSRLRGQYFVMCSLSGLLATLGIILNDTAILIAAMVLAPILNPVLALAAGLSLFHRKLTLYAVKGFFGGVFFVILVSALFVKTLVFFGYTIDITTFSEKFREYNPFLLIAAFYFWFFGSVCLASPQCWAA
jgi:hypothetical protein